MTAAPDPDLFPRALATADMAAIPSVKLSRPVLRYLGGKWKLAPWIVSHFPPHRLYVEPFGGAASVLLRKPRSHGEVYNDLDGDLVNLFAVLRCPLSSARLVELVALTPYARAEFDSAYERCADPVERARRLVVRSYMGFGSNAANLSRNTGFRSDAKREYRTPAQEWGRFPPALAAIAERVQSGVQIECRPARDVIAQRDGPQTLFYVDPPYLHETRSAKRKHGGLHNAYAHEMTDADHVALIDQLLEVEGMVVLSGYPHQLYDERLRHWRRVQRTAHADGARERTEVLWLNGRALVGLLEARQ
jgi:DNA adenine methylase